MLDCIFQSLPSVHHHWSGCSSRCSALVMSVVRTEEGCSFLAHGGWCERQRVLHSGLQPHSLSRCFLFIVFQIKPGLFE